MKKRGWIKLVEMTIAILLVAGLLFLFVGQSQIEKEDISLQIYEAESVVLREIQLDENLREDILTVSSELLPIEWQNFGVDLIDVTSLIKEKTPSYLECEAKICELGEPCLYDTNKKIDIYAQSTAITATKTTQEFRQLKLFCWVK